MQGMFRDTTTFNQPLNSWNVGKVITFSSVASGGMFQNATAFNQPLNSWKINSATTMNTTTGGMFQGATSFNQPLNSWNVSNITDMRNMFQGATSFNQDISSWNVSKVTNMSNMFQGDILSPINYNALLTAWSSEALKTGVAFHAGNSKYCAVAAPQRANIISAHTWTITDA